MTVDNFTVLDSLLVSILNMGIIFVLLGVFYILTSLLPDIARHVEKKKS